MIAPAWHDPVSCWIEDISSTGSRVRITDATSQRTQRIPERVLLRLAIDHSEIECNIVWNKHDEMGLRYASFFRSSSRQTS